MNRATHTIDASGVPLGRVATQVARFLMGKHRASYVPYKDEGDVVVVKNFRKVTFTGAKMDQKRYWRPTTRPGSLTSETLRQLWQRRPEEVLRKAVYGMLPKNTLRKQMIKRLSINDATT